MHPLCYQPAAMEHIFQEHQPLMQTVCQGQIQIRPGDQQRQTGKPGTGTYINHPGVSRYLHKTQRLYGVDKMLFQYAIRIGNAGQIHFFVPRHQSLGIQIQPLGCVAVHSNV